MTTDDYLPASFWRRLLAIVYDLVVLVCLVFIAWQPVPFVIQEGWPEWFSQLIRRSYLVLVVFFFFGWFWTHGGQTIGMRAWKVLLIDADHTTTDDVASRRVTWGQAIKRFVGGIVSLLPAGLGFIWSLFDSERRAWHDRLSSTRLVQIR